MPSFEEASEKVVAIHRGGWKDGGKSAKQWRASLGEYAYPRIGTKGVDQVTTADVMAVVLPIWTSKHETAQRVRWRISVIMKWAIAQGYRSDNPAGEAIAAALPRRPVKVRHMPALPHGEVSAAIAAVHASRGWVGAKLAFEFQVLTAARSAEVRLATWDEFDLGAMMWTVPDTRMKAQREHRVPLCGRALSILREAGRLSQAGAGHEPTGLVFPSRRGMVLAEGGISKLVKMLGIAAVPHGFRSSFRDWAAERTNHPREVIEAALAHVVSNQTEAAYRPLGPVRAAAAADGATGPATLARLTAAARGPRAFWPGDSESLARGQRVSSGGRLGVFSARAVTSAGRASVRAAADSSSASISLTFALVPRHTFRWSSLSSVR